MASVVRKTWWGIQAVCVSAFAAAIIFVNFVLRNEADDGPQIQQKPPTSVTHDSPFRHPFRYDPDYTSYMYDNDVWGSPLAPFD